MAHQELLSSLKADLFITIVLALAFSASAFALDFTPGKWKISNWIESPDGRKAKEESSEECLTETNFLPFGCDEPDCEGVNSQIIGNEVSFNYIMKNHKSPLKIDGVFNYHGREFDGYMFYTNQKNPSDSLKVIMRGERIGKCSD